MNRTILLLPAVAAALLAACAGGPAPASRSPGVVYVPPLPPVESAYRAPSAPEPGGGTTGTAPSGAVAGGDPSASFVGPRVEESYVDVPPDPGELRAAYVDAGPVAIVDGHLVEEAPVLDVGWTLGFHDGDWGWGVSVFYGWPWYDPWYTGWYDPWWCRTRIVHHVRHDRRPDQGRWVRPRHDRDDRRPERTVEPFPRDRRAPTRGDLFPSGDEDRSRLRFGERRRTAPSIERIAGARERYSVPHWRPSPAPAAGRGPTRPPPASDDRRTAGSDSGVFDRDRTDRARDLFPRSASPRSTSPRIATPRTTSPRDEDDGRRVRSEPSRIPPPSRSAFDRARSRTGAGRTERAGPRRRR